MKRNLPGRGRDVREKANWAEPYKSMALLSSNALILAQRSQSWLLTRLQGMLPRQCPSWKAAFVSRLRAAGKAIPAEPG